MIRAADQHPGSIAAFLAVPFAPFAHMDTVCWPVESPLKTPIMVVFTPSDPASAVLTKPRADPVVVATPSIRNSKITPVPDIVVASSRPVKVTIIVEVELILVKYISVAT